MEDRVDLIRRRLIDGLDGRAHMPRSDDADIHADFLLKVGSSAVA